MGQRLCEKQSTGWARHTARTTITPRPWSSTTPNPLAKRHADRVQCRRAGAAGETSRVAVRAGPTPTGPPPWNKGRKDGLTRTGGVRRAARGVRRATPPHAMRLPKPWSTVARAAQWSAAAAHNGCAVAALVQLCGKAARKDGWHPTRRTTTSDANRTPATRRAVTKLPDDAPGVWSGDRRGVPLPLPRAGVVAGERSICGVRFLWATFLARWCTRD